MPIIDSHILDLLYVEEALWLAVRSTGLPSYDVAFEQLFACRRPWQRPELVTAVGRFGVSSNYAELYAALAAEGVRLIHTPEQYQLASELPLWYPRLAPWTPRSMWFDAPPPAAEIERHFSWPVFLKSARQTIRKRAALSIVRSAEEYERAAEHYRFEPALQGQAFVCREFLPLRHVEADANDRIPPAFEFRSFWWRGECVRAGPYWGALYSWTAQERRAALAIAAQAAAALDLPFVSIDLAQTADGTWVIIECNDGQESGCGAIPPVALWQRIVEIERGGMQP